MTDVYKRLAEKLDAMPNGFPSTESGVELKILQKIFTPEDAELALKIRPIPETAAQIAKRLGKPVDEMEALLDAMVKKGQIGSARMNDQQVFVFFPFVFGIFEFQQPRLDKELAELVEEYQPSLMGTLGHYAPAVMRVVPVNIQIDAQHQVQPYEDLLHTLEKAKSFQIMDCICKKEKGLLGDPCKHPMEVCMAFANHEGAFDKYPLGRVISKEEAIEVVRKADEEGLVHATFNVQNGQMFVCNCCSCCCGMLRGMNQYNAPNLMAKSNYLATINQDTCASCGICADERCPVKAIAETDSGYEVQQDRCIGCGICVPTCATDSITLVRKPDAVHETPPDHLMDWYFKRAQSRGTKIVVD
jgi:H+/Na+-translocating ferredoxin:NAD+ oxidoreductase subunit B